MTAIDITTVVPTFRRPQQVGEAVRSALAQEGVSIEVRVIDDSPEGSAREAVEAIGDARVTYSKRDTPRADGPPPCETRRGRAQMGDTFISSTMTTSLRRAPTVPTSTRSMGAGMRR